MPTATFIEAGGDATYEVKNNAGGNAGFWQTNYGGAGVPVIKTDFVNGGHIKSIGNVVNSISAITTTSCVADAGGRVSFYLYLNALPAAAARLAAIVNAAEGNLHVLALTTGGVLQLRRSTPAGTQIGSNGATLSTGRWYRIAVAYVVTSTSVNDFAVFVVDDTGTSLTGISAHNFATAITASAKIMFGNNGAVDTTWDWRISDIYCDQDSSFTDPGTTAGLMVTAKRPFSNGTLNEWTTQIGSGNSGYGSGHADEVNERALNVANGWSMNNAALKTEEYTLEASSAGDIDISAATILDSMGWIVAKVGSASTGNIIVNGTATNKSLTTTRQCFTAFAGSTSYLSGANAIGMDNNTVAQLFSLYECGVQVAYIPATASVGNTGFFRLMSA